MNRIFAGLIFALVYCTSALAGVDVYEFAKSASSSANESFRRNPPNDGATLSAKSYPDGKAVVYEFVIAFKRDVPDSSVATWRMATRSEVVPQGCALIRSTPVFKQGFHLRYRYLNRDGRVMDDFLVNKPACEGL